MSNEKIQKVYEELNFLKVSQEWDKIIQICEENLKETSKDTNNLLLHFLKAESLIRKKDYDAGDQLLEKVVSEIAKDDYDDLAIARAYDLQNDFEKAIEHLKKSKLSESKYLLGYYHEKGYGTSRNLETAYKYYLESAENGSFKSQYSLFLFYQKGIYVSKDQKKAFEWLLKSADSGFSLAQTEVGNTYFTGSDFVEKDEKKGILYYEKSAKQKDVLAIYQLGKAFEKGLGVEINLKKALEYYKSSCELGFDQGGYECGRFYYGGFGIEKDLKRAFDYFMESSLKGNQFSQCSLGLCYETGSGVEKNLSEALKWYQISADQGNELGNERYNALFQELKKK